ncbi:MAG TPA: hypothetical protein VMR21_07385 [Vicinamibacteria bacterium]|nr:hypothetical protein [Vicinamibacteria bacterium]
MPIEVWRLGDYRVCPTCNARHKVQDIQCARCKTVLAGTRVHHAASAPVSVAGHRSSHGPRLLVVAGALVALGAGLWVRSVFRGAEIQDTVVAANTDTPAPRPAESTWQPPVLSYPPVVGYNTGVPASLAPLAIEGAPSAATEAPGGGMISIAPSSQPLGQTAFTDDDLARVGSTDGPVRPPMPSLAPVAATAPPAAPNVPRAPVAPVPAEQSAAVGIPSAAVAEAAARAVAVPTDEAREWISRLHDRQEDVQKAQAKVRRIEVEAESARLRLGAAAGEDARKDAERDLRDALDDLEKAEKKRARAQRELDETHERAREKGVRLER